MDQVTLRLMARHAQLQRALRQEEPREVLRAASRARLAQLDLLPAERIAAKRARAMVGRALREARLRARLPAPAFPIASAPSMRRVAGRWRIVALAALAIVIVALLWQLQPTSPVDVISEPPGGAAAGAVVSQVATSESSRGRTVDFVAVAVQSAAPAATPEPSASPAVSAAPTGGAATGTVGGGGGQGGAGGGTGSGVGSGSGSGVATPTPSPKPTATPIPPVASGYTRIRGRVIDPATGQGVAGVCLVPGSLECDLTKPYSDANGYFAIDVTTGAYWDIRFQATGYRVARIRVYAGGTEVNVGNIRIARSF
jgi:hypothetical protein